MKPILFFYGFFLLILIQMAQVNHSSYEGEFQIQPGFNIVISSDGEDLYVTPTNKPKERLTKIENDLYKIESINGKIDFSLLEEKDVVVVYMYGTILHSPRLPYNPNFESKKEIELSSEELKQYVGTYKVMPNKDLIVALDDDGLTAQMKGEPIFPIFPYDTNKFFYKVVPTHLEFVKDDDGSVKYLLLRQSIGILQANKK